MRKKVKIAIRYLLIILAAAILSSLTQVVDLYGQPKITQPGLNGICHTTALYKPSLPPPHDSGFPIPYVTHYVEDGGCGVGKPVVWNLFILNSILWALLLIGLGKAAAKHKKR